MNINFSFATDFPLYLFVDPQIVLGGPRERAEPVHEANEEVTVDT